MVCIPRPCPTQCPHKKYTGKFQISVQSLFN
ncbi:unnamed protein product [Protopolystoma xenopodis]|uniref:Uncharacterized protein n=1 Tax=Protopolystoma xenopodis TaxID=117903 RepID=A0A3S5CR97_9PLAT|nr:unnamed protein product [Protopolystoma xenopodis]